MNSKWFKVAAVTLLLLMAVALSALAEGGVTAKIDFAVEYDVPEGIVIAPIPVVMKALGGAPEPQPGKFEDKTEGTFKMTFTEPGNYSYELRQMLEFKNKDPFVTYDDTKYNVMVTVYWNEAGDGLKAVVEVGVGGDPTKPEKVTFKNVHKLGALRIEKTVTGAGGNRTREWHFTITLDEKVNDTFGGIRFYDGVGQVTLKHGEKVTIDGLPAGVGYTVTEDEANKSGYKTTSTGTTGTITADTVLDVAFVNDNDGTSSSPRTSDETMLILWAVLAAVSLAAILYILLTGRKRRDKEESDS